MASKILVVAAYRRKLSEIAAQAGINQLLVVVPPAWQEPGGRRLVLEPGELGGYQLRVAPIRFNGSFHLFHWPRLARLIAEFKPDIVHIDEEAYNLSTFLGVRATQRVGAKSVFFTWQNLLRRYPPPFNLFERYVFKTSAHAIAGSAEALRVLRAKGYGGPASVIPQFGVDPELFAPPDLPCQDPPTIGFVARLVEEKGIFVLLDAVAGLAGDWRLHVIGSGPLKSRAQDRAAALGIGNRITWEPGVHSTQMASRMQHFTLVVQPSLTRKHWKEQFGRALMEAMSCGVAVVGSDSGEIPHLIGDAGLVVREGDPLALRFALARLLADSALCSELGARGRARVLACFTHRRVAEQTVSVYRSVLNMSAGDAGQRNPVCT
jgi:glycosyltransferase involved in cell wall biosynthesis